MSDDNFAPDHLEGVEYIMRKQNNDLLGGIIAQQQTRIEELEAKLTKAVGLLEAWINVATHCTIEEGVCCCGDNMDTHAEPINCGHSPVDHGAYIAEGLVEETNATLAELTGGKDE